MVIAAFAEVGEEVHKRHHRLSHGQRVPVYLMAGESWLALRLRWKPVLDALQATVVLGGAGS